MSPHLFSAILKRDGPGRVELPPLPYSLVCIHVGPSVRTTWWRDGRMHEGVEVHGDIDVIPAGIASIRQSSAEGVTLVLRLPPALIQAAARECGLDEPPALLSRHLTRDAQIEHIGWAIKAEIEAGSPGGRPFLERLGGALAVHLVQRHSSMARRPAEAQGGLSGLKLRQLLAHIDDNLDRPLLLADVAQVAGLSVTHMKTRFRESTGLPVHQYVLRRRVDRAKTLLLDGRLPISQVAAVTGFAHQSHLSRHVRRLLGVTPSALRRGTPALPDGADWIAPRQP